MLLAGKVGVILGTTAAAAGAAAADSGLARTAVKQITSTKNSGGRGSGPSESFPTSSSLEEGDISPLSEFLNNLVDLNFYILILIFCLLYLLITGILVPRILNNTKSSESSNSIDNSGIFEYLKKYFIYINKNIEKFMLPFIIIIIILLLIFQTINYISIIFLNNHIEDFVATHNEINIKNMNITNVDNNISKNFFILIFVKIKNTLDRLK